MARRIVTREDVEAARGQGTVEIGPDDVVTEAARELAKRSGVSIRATSSQLDPLPSRSSVQGAEPARDSHNAIVTAVGRNRRFILAELTQNIAELGGSVHDISQRIVGNGEYFSTIFVVDLSDVESFVQFKGGLEALSREGDYRVVVQHERIFQAMHRI